MWGAVQVMLVDFQAMTPKVFPMAVPLRTLTPHRGTEVLGHRPFRVPSRCSAAAH